MALDQAQERRLVRAARKDPEAFGRLFDAYFARILAYAYRRSGNLADAEDAAAETFFKALQALGRFRWRRGGFLAWLYRIAAREVAGLQRRRARGQRRRLALAELPPPVQAEQAAFEEDEAGRALSAALARALAGLEPLEREIVLLHYVQGESYALVAEATGVKESTLRVRSLRARQKLQQLLEQEGWDHDQVRQILGRAELADLDAGIPGLSPAALDLRTP